jgi:hypothetical protein
MATPDRESIIYFPFGGTEYQQCKEARGQMDGLVTKSIDKIRVTLEKQNEASDLIIVAHGKEKHSPHREPKLYSESGCFGVNKKTANDLIVKLRNGLGTSFSSTKIGGIYLWICYSSSSGLGAAFGEALRKEKLSVYATPLEIGGVGVWNARRLKVGEDSFVLVP